MIRTIEGQEKFGIGAGGDVSTKIDLLAKNPFFRFREEFFNPDVVGKECGFIEGKDNGLVVMDGVADPTNANWITILLLFACLFSRYQFKIRY